MIADKKANPAISFNTAIKTAAADGNQGVDLQGFNQALILILSGTITDGTLYTWQVSECDTLGGSYSAVADADLQSGGPTAGDLEPTFAAATDDTIKWLYYTGSKRFIRVDLLSVTGSPGTGGYFSAVIVRLNPIHSPQP